MTIPALSGVGAVLSSSALGAAGGLGEQSQKIGEHAAGLAQPASPAGNAAGGSNEFAVGKLETTSGLEGTNGLEGTSGLEATSGVEAAGGASGGGFSGALTNAVSSLEQTQQTASSASQALASGTLSDPESAVVTVEEAQLAMQLAAQIRTKATEAAQQIFQTQV